MLPPQYDDDACDHATQVGIMCHMVHSSRQAKEELKQAVSQHDPLGLEGERERDDVHAHIGEYHGKGQQQAENCTRSAYSDQGVIASLHGDYLTGRGIPHIPFAGLDALPDAVPRELPNQFLDQSRSKATCDIIEQVSLGAHHPFQQTAEHEQGEHVAEQVQKTGIVMHKHIGEELGRIEIASFPEMQPQISKCSTDTDTTEASHTMILIINKCLVTGLIVDKNEPLLYCMIHLLNDGTKILKNS